MSIASSMKDEILSSLLDDQDGVAETITYYPGGGAGISIKAVVIHGGLDNDPVIGRRRSDMSIVIVIANDATLGVTSVDVGKDEFEVTVHGKLRRKRVKAIVDPESDEVTWMLRG